MKETLEIVELILKISKDVILGVVLLILGIWVVNHYDIKMREKLSIGDVADAFMRGPAPSKEAIILVANQTDKKEGAADTAATGAQADAALAINSDMAGWVFLGTFKDGKFFGDSYFDFSLDKIPAVDTFATSKVDMNKRASKPYLNEEREWWKGKVIGLITAGTKVKFLEVAQDIPAKGGGFRLWARVAPVKSGSA